MEGTKQGCVLLCVTAQKSSLRLLEAAAALAKRQQARLELLCVLKPTQEEAPDAQALTLLEDMAHRSGGRLSVYFSDSPVLVAAAFAKKTGATSAVMGFTRERPGGQPPFPALLRQMLPEVPIAMVAADGALYQMLPSLAFSGKS
jgi:K+-sensing histidine kinase KdpD